MLQWQSMQPKRSRLLRIGKHFIPGVKRVQMQVEPYAAAWHTANSGIIGAHEKVWVVLGDSMSQGIGASAYNKGWVGQAYAMLKAKGRSYRVVNLSSSGARIPDVLKFQLPALEKLSVKPALVTVLIGSNDLLSPIARRQLLPNLRKLLLQLPEGAFIGNVFYRPTAPRLVKLFLASNTAGRLLTALARHRRLNIVSFDDAFRPPWKGTLASDRFHPNDKGYASIAEIFVAAIEKARSM